MEENEYRSLYRAINQQRCIFEKTILSRRASCHYAHRFNLADREGVSCQHSDAATLCKATLDLMRDKAMFALKLTKIDGPLPHAKEIKVQTGGLFGLQQILHCGEAVAAIEDITALLETAVTRYGAIDKLPYEEIARTIVQFEGRSRRKIEK